MTLMASTVRQTEEPSNGLEPAQHAHRLPFAASGCTGLWLGLPDARTPACLPAILRLPVARPAHINLVNDETESAF